MSETFRYQKTIALTVESSTPLEWLTNGWLTKAVREAIGTTEPEAELVVTVGGGGPRQDPGVEVDKMVEKVREAFLQTEALERWHDGQHNPVAAGLEKDEAGAFIPGLGTVRPCRVCGCLVAGGPTACKACVNGDE